MATVYMISGNRAQADFYYHHYGPDGPNREKSYRALGFRMIHLDAPWRIMPSMFNKDDIIAAVGTYFDNPRYEEIDAEVKRTLAKRSPLDWPRSVLHLR